MRKMRVYVYYIYIDDCNKCAAANAACVFYVHRRSSQYSSSTTILIYIFDGRIIVIIYSFHMYFIHIES